MSVKSTALLLGLALPAAGMFLASAAEFEPEMDPVQIRDCSVIVRIGGDIEPAVQPIGTDLSGGVTVGYVSDGGRLSIAIGDGALAIQGVSIGAPTGIAIGVNPLPEQKTNSLPGND